jgi:hypothetical protein
VRTKNAKPISASERRHLSAIKGLPCSVCDEPGPSEAHHVKQGQHFTAVALCESCHRGSRLGWHGGRWMWRIKKMDEIDALAVTLARAYGGSK